MAAAAAPGGDACGPLHYHPPTPEIGGCMAIRFRKRITLAPGLRMNLSGSGISWSVGPRGASMTFGKRGTYLNAGIPGTGLYSRGQLGSAPRSAAATQRAGANGKVTIEGQVKVEEDGTLVFTDSAGAPLAEHLVERAKKQNREAILGAVQSVCDDINQRIESVAEVHRTTPRPDQKPRFDPPPFEELQPRRPTPAKPGFFAKLFRSKREAIEQQNAAALRAYEAKLADWQKAKADYEAAVAARRKLVEQDIYTDTAAMEQHFEGVLGDIDWPRETEVSFEIADAGAAVLLDVDLPEVEDMPTKTATVPQRGLKLNVKELPATKVRKLYMDHIHGVVFRVIGEAFAALPTVQTVVASGYSQRPEKSTGQIVDEYLLSVRVSRHAWQQIDFGNLAALDPADALGRFDLRREVTKTGVFSPIEPFSS